MTENNNSNVQSPVTPTTPAQSYLTAQPVVENANAPKTNQVVLGYDPAKYETKTENTVEKTDVGSTEVKSTDLSDKDRAHKLAQLAKTERKVQQQQKEAEEIIKRADSYKNAFNETDLI